MEQARIGKLPEVGGKLRADLPIPNERDLAATIVGPSGPAGLRDMNHGLMECLCKRKENNIDLVSWPMIGHRLPLGLRISGD